MVLLYKLLVNVELVFIFIYVGVHLVVEAYHYNSHYKETYGNNNLANHIKQTVFAFIHSISFFTLLYIYKYAVILKSFHKFVENLFFNPKNCEKMEDFTKMTTEELESRLKDIIRVCDDYYFNQHFIEKYRNNKSFNATAERLGKSQEEIQNELERRKVQKMQ